MIKNCPNCGAPIQHKYNHKCAYCGTFFDFNIEETKKIDYRDIEDIRFHGMRRIPTTFEIALLFKGTYRKKCQPLEFSQNNIMEFTVDSDCLKATSIQMVFKIEIFDFEEIMRGGIVRLDFLPFKYDLNKLIYEIKNYMRKEREER